MRRPAGDEIEFKGRAKEKWGRLTVCSAARNVFALRQFCVCHREAPNGTEPPPMHGLIYLIGLIVVILFILSLLGLR
jgi:hypothetical protein